jgi:hypothetical protein
MLVRFCALVLVSTFALVASACGHTYEVEGRQTRVNVWLTAPALAERGESIQALVYVGPYKVVDGPVSFPQGIDAVVLPPVYVRQGQHTVSVILGDAKFRATQAVNVQRECWLDVTLREKVLKIAFFETEPSRIGR